MPVLGEKIPRCAPGDAPELLVVQTKVFGDRAAVSFAVTIAGAATVSSARSRAHGALRPPRVAATARAGAVNCSVSVLPAIATGGALRADGGLHGVEIAGADEGLMLGRPIARALLAEFALLQLRVAEHAVRAVGRGQLEHRQIQRMPARERDELKAIARGQRALRAISSWRPHSSFACPVERWRAVVGQQLAGKFGVNGRREALAPRPCRAWKFRTRSDRSTARRRGRARSPARCRP